MTNRKVWVALVSTCLREWKDAKLNLWSLWINLPNLRTRYWQMRYEVGVSLIPFRWCKHCSGRQRMLESLKIISAIYPMKARTDVHGISKISPTPRSFHPWSEEEKNDSLKIATLDISFRWLSSQSDKCKAPIAPYWPRRGISSPYREIFRHLRRFGVRWRPHGLLIEALGEKSWTKVSWRFLSTQTMRMRWIRMKIFIVSSRISTIPCVWARSKNACNGHLDSNSCRTFGETRQITGFGCDKPFGLLGSGIISNRRPADVSERPSCPPALWLKYQGVARIPSPSLLRALMVAQKAWLHQMWWRCFLQKRCLLNLAAMVAWRVSGATSQIAVKMRFFFMQNIVGIAVQAPREAHLRGRLWDINQWPVRWKPHACHQSCAALIGAGCAWGSTCHVTRAFHSSVNQSPDRVKYYQSMSQEKDPRILADFVINVRLAASHGFRIDRGNMRIRHWFTSSVFRYPQDRQWPKRLFRPEPLSVWRFYDFGSDWAW